MAEEKQHLRITQITQVNPWVRRFRLEPAKQGGQLAPFLAGQYLTIFYEIDGATTSRPYSISSAPKDAMDGFYELYIHGDGAFTARWLFETGRAGMTLYASLPEGEFCYLPQRDGTRVIGISGGMSVTPLHAMARAVADGTLDMDLTIVCGWDKREEVLFREEFSYYARTNPQIKVVFVVADGGENGDESGYITLDILQRHANLSNAKFFLCGPEAMYHAVQCALAQVGIASCRVQQELRGEAKWTAVCPQIAQAHYTLTVTMGGAQRKFPLDSRETVLVAMERAGLAPPTRCRSGHCGFCLARLTAGRVFVPKWWDERTTAEQVQGRIHPCCSFPRSDITISI